MLMTIESSTNAMPQPSIRRTAPALRSQETRNESVIPAPSKIASVQKKIRIPTYMAAGISPIRAINRIPWVMIARIANATHAPIHAIARRMDPASDRSPAPTTHSVVIGRPRSP